MSMLLRILLAERYPSRSGFEVSPASCSARQNGLLLRRHHMTVRTRHQPGSSAQLHAQEWSTIVQQGWPGLCKGRANAQFRAPARLSPPTHTYCNMQQQHAGSHD